MAWFDELPLEYSESSTRNALRLLQRGYDDPDLLKEAARLAGIDAGDIDFRKAANVLAMAVMDAAARQGRMTQLLAEVLVDRSAAGIRDDLWRLLGSDAPRVHAAALATKADFDRMAALPSPSTYALNGDEGELQRIVNVLSKFNDSAVFRFEIAQREARVVRIDISPGGISGSEWSGRGEGTGWLVGPDLVLTNHHVVAAVSDWGDVTVLLDHKVVPQLGGATLDPGRRVRLADDPLLARSEAAAKPVEFSEAGPDPSLLDFALLRLAEPVGSEGLGPDGQGDEPRGWFALPGAAHEFNSEEGLFVLGHPMLSGDTEAGPLKLTFAFPSSAQLIENGCRVRYSVNTKGGSSGSPVMDQDFKPLALHHGSSADVVQWDKAGLWPGGFNQGVPLHLIVADIQKKVTPDVLAAPGLQ